MKEQKLKVLAYGLLLASIFGSVVDRPSKPLPHTTYQYTLETLRWQDVNKDEGDDDDEFTIIATRFLFPEKPKNPSASL